MRRSEKSVLAKGSRLSIFELCGLVRMKTSNVPIAAAFATSDDHRKL
jgi:hypothetical protein